MAPVLAAPIRIAVVESDPLRFLGLHTIFSDDSDFQLRASSIPEILNDRFGDVILITANDGRGFASDMAAVKTVLPSARILVTGASQQDEDLLKAISAGAKGYVCVDAAPEEFKQAIRVVHSGSVWVPRRILSLFIERITAPSRRTASRIIGEKISERERSVLRLLVAGRSNREIGRELGILERTVKAHVTQLMRKVGVSNRIELSVHAVTRSLLASRC